MPASSCRRRVPARRMPRRRRADRRASATTASRSATSSIGWPELSLWRAPTDNDDPPGAWRPVPSPASRWRDVGSRPPRADRHEPFGARGDTWRRVVAYRTATGAADRAPPDRSRRGWRRRRRRGGARSTDRCRDLPRVGVSLRAPGQGSRSCRGSGSGRGRATRTAAPPCASAGGRRRSRDQALPFVVPQEHGLHLDTVWFELDSDDRPRCAHRRRPTARLLRPAPLERGPDGGDPRPPARRRARRRSSTSTSPTAASARSPAARTPTTASSCTAAPTASAGPSPPDPVRVFVRRPSTSDAPAPHTRHSDGRKHSGVTPLSVRSGHGGQRHVHPATGRRRSMRWPPPSRAAKGGDPLAPVAVVVPTNTAGVMARRALGRRGGVAAIDVLTLFRLAELLGAPSLHAEGRKPGLDTGRRPRRQAGHPRHPRPLRRRQPPPVDGRRPARPVPRAARRRPRVAHRAGPHRPRPRAGARRRRGRPAARPDWYDEGDLLARAAERARHDLPERLRRVVVHLPQRLRPLERSCWPRSASAATSSSSSGSPATPTPTPTSSPSPRRSPAARSHPPLGAPPPPAGDVDRRVDHRRRRRGAHRRARRRRRRPRRHPLRPHRRALPGRPALRPARRAPARPPPASPWNGRPGTGVGERMVPRVLAELLELDRRGLRRSDADDAARRRARPAAPTAGPCRPPGGSASAGPPASCARRTGTPTSSATPTTCAAATRRPGRRGRRRGRCELLAFVGELRAALGDPAAPRPWAAWVALGQGAARAVVRARRARPPRRRRARRRWEQTTQGARPPRPPRPIGGPVTRAEFRATFVAELDVTPGPPRQGRRRRPRQHARRRGRPRRRRRRAPRRGRGAGAATRRPSTRCSATTSAQLAGLEGSAERAGARPPPVPRRRHDHAGSVIVTVPRGDLRATATHHQSRWIAPLLARQRGRCRVVIDSHAHGLAADRVPGLGRRAPPARSCGRAPAPATTSATCRSPRDDAVLRRALRLRDARASDRVHRVRRQPHRPRRRPAAGDRVADPHRDLGRRARTPTSCSYVLGVRPIDEPADIETLSPLDRGIGDPRRHRPPAPRRARRHAPASRGRRAGPTSTPPPCSAPAPRSPTPSTPPGAPAGRRSGSTPGPSCWPRSTRGWRSTASAGPAARSRVVRAGVRRRRARRAGPPRRSRHRLPRQDRPRRRAARRHARRHRPQDGQARTGSASVSADDPTLGGTALPAPGLRRRRPRPARPPEGAGARRVHVLQAEVHARRAGARRRRRSSASATSSRRVVDGIEAGVFPADPRAAELVPLHVAAGSAIPTASARRRRWADWERKRPRPACSPRWFPLDDEEADADG